MKMKPVPDHSRKSGDADDVEDLLRVANVLLAAHTHSTVDRTTDRGRYMYTTLLHYRKLLHTAHPTHVLVKLFECDYAAGMGGEAGTCYDDVIAQLQAHTCTDLKVPLITANSHDDITALQCIDGTTTNITTAYLSAQYACHLHYAQLRRLRHSMLHEVNPLRTLQLGGAMHVQYADTTHNIYSTNSMFNTYIFLAYALAGSVREQDGISYSVLASDIVFECDNILQYLSVHSNEAVHTLFTKLCMPYRSIGTGSSVLSIVEYLFNSLGERAYTDYHRSVVASLLSIGAVGTATVRTLGYLQYMLYDGEYSVDYGDSSVVDSVVYGEFGRIVMINPSINLLIDSANTGSANTNTMPTLLHSANVRSALLLSHALHTMQTDHINTHAMSRFVSYEFQSLATEFVNVLFHATTPVVLSLSPVEYGTIDKTVNGSTTTTKDSSSSVQYMWLQEAIVLRTILVNTLQTLLHTCTTANSLTTSTTHTTNTYTCALLDPTAHVAGRGLFLLAYQGLGLTKEMVRLIRHMVVEKVSGDDDSTGSGELVKLVDELLYITSDHTVPHLYEQLVHASSLGTGSIEPYSGISGSSITVANATSTDNTSTTSNTSTTTDTTLASTRKIKVGFVSFFFRRHPVGRLLSKIITQLNSTVFDTYLIIQQDMYTTNTNHPSHNTYTAHTTHTTHTDPITHYLHTNITPSHIMRIPRDEKTALHTLRAENFDIIVYGDVFMDAFIAHLAMHRVGKVQVSFWGHPFTSGYSSIDYFVSSDSFERRSDKFR